MPSNTTDSKTEDDVEPIIEINKNGDMCCTVLFLVEIFALLRHAQNRSKNEGEEQVLVQLVIGTITLVFAIFVCKRIGGEIGKYISRNFVAGDPMSKPVLQSKFSDQFWQLVVHVSMTIFELMILSENDFSWLWNPDETWIPPPWKQSINPLVEKFYLTQLCIWVATGLSHKFLEERHKDYFVMYIHHIATLGLVFGSWSVNYTRIGVLVLFVHDASDISIDLLKMTNNLKLHDRAGLYICETCFVTVLITWAWARGWFLATKILPSTAFGCVRVILDEEHDEDKYKQYEFTNFKKEELPDLTHDQLIQVGSTMYDLYPTMNLLLTAILCMNIYWYYLLLRIMVGQCKGEGPKSGNKVYEGPDGNRGPKLVTKDAFKTE